MIELVTADVGQRSIAHACVLHVNAEDAATEFEGMLRAALPCPKNVPLVDVNPGLAVHTGAGLVGTCMVIE
jgi:fatty acid-binding protein DegV